MLNESQVKTRPAMARLIESPIYDELDFGPLTLLPGRWRSANGRGWSMIAVPVSGGSFNYRLQLNQYNEDLTFSIMDRSPSACPGNPTDAPNQPVVALAYEQSVTQIAAADRAVSGETSGPNLSVLQEPGLFLFMTNQETHCIDIARLAIAPNGEPALALGHSSVSTTSPLISVTSGLPIGGPTDLGSRFLEPYRHFHSKPFQGQFDPFSPNALLRSAIAGQDILRTTILKFDTQLESVADANLPFITKTTKARAMESTFWIHELNAENPDGTPRVLMQYTQTVLLEFFDRAEGETGMIKWPCISRPISQ